VPKLFEIEQPSSDKVTGKTNFKRMRHPLHLVLTALNLYFFQNSTTRKVSEFLWMQHEIKLSHVTISKWVLTFASVFQTIADRRTAQLDFSCSDEWHCDETYVTINGQNYYLWFVLDSETRFVLDFHLSPGRDSNAAHAILANCRNKFGSPRSAIVSDRYRAYVEPVALFFNQARHIRVEDFDDWISNNLIESFHGQFKAWYHPKRGFNSFACANNLVAMYVFFYNFLRPHSALSGLTPAQVAGDSYSDKLRRHWLLFA
jgi:transposase-like protein